MVQIKKLIMIVALSLGSVAMAQNLSTPNEINKLMLSEKLEEADKKVDAVIASKPNNSLAYMFKSLIKFKAGEAKEAEFYLKLAEKKSPNILFAKNKEMYFTYRKDLFEVLARPSEIDKYKNKDYSAIFKP